MTSDFVNNAGWFGSNNPILKPPTTGRLYTEGA